MRTRLSLAMLAVAASASAQPAPPGPQTPTADVKALNQQGIELHEQKKYDQALAVFKEAFARFKSAKILLNLGTTLKLLDRKADAANEYQRYLDAPDSDPARRAEVTAVLAELDKSVGRLHVDVSPADAEVQIDAASSMIETDSWRPRAEVVVVRAEPGEVRLRARRDGYVAGSATAKLAAGQDAALSLKLVAVAAPKPLIITKSVVERPRSRFGARAIYHVDVYPTIGSALLVGGTADVLPQLAIDAGLVLGPGLVKLHDYTTAPAKLGAYVGASYAFLTGKLRPLAIVRVPVMASNGARVLLRVAGGAEYVITRNFAVTLELGLELSLNPEPDICDNATGNPVMCPTAPSVGQTLTLVPALGIAGRL